MSSRKVLLAGAAALVGVGWAGLAPAAVVVSRTLGQYPDGTVSNSDLLAGLLPAVSGTALGGEESTSKNTTLLTDGSYGGDGSTATYSGAVAIKGGTVLTYTLDLLASPGGYSITAIDTYTSWNDLQRLQQKYDVAYSTVGDPNTFVTIASPNYGAGGSTNPSNAHVHIADDDNVALASNVAKIRFTVTQTSTWYDGYRELDVHGTPVPEPASLGLLAIGALGLLGRRRRAS